MPSGIAWRRRWPSTSASSLMDLRGYGDSGRPAADAQHVRYSKREMALDALAVMQHLGFERFGVLAHDRGARVAHRLAADHPAAVERLMLLDIAPTLAMYENTTEAFARAYWHWFFLIQPPPLARALIDSDPVRYVRSVMGGRHAGLAPFAPEAWPSTSAASRSPARAQAICEDYRAVATIDLEHDRADSPPAASSPAAARAVGRARRGRPLLRRAGAVARARRRGVAAAALPCGHYIPEEAPRELLAEALPFFLQREHKDRDHEQATHRSHRRRRHRQGNHARGPARARCRGPQVRHRPAVRPLRFLQLGLLREARQDAAGRLEGPDRRPRRDLLRRRRLAREDRRTTSRSGARCCCSAASSTSTSTCGRRA